MALPLDILHTAMTSREPHAWTTIQTAIADLTPSPEAETMLVRLLQLDGTLNLAAGGYLPHSQSPMDMLRAAAIETLWQWTGPKYAEVCQRAAENSDSPIVQRLVATRFATARERG
jgi:hypothetical protein